jgi:hypothetical protein
VDPKEKRAIMAIQESVDYEDLKGPRVLLVPKEIMVNLVQQVLLAFR